MKRYIINIGLSLVLIFGFTSCNNWLDLKPESQIVLEDFWKSESDVNAVLASCYRGMSEDAFIYRLIVWGELRSDDVVQGNAFPTSLDGMRKILQGDILPNNAYCNWGQFYTVINYCNTLLYYAPYVVDRDENFTVAKLNKVRAEALTIRSLCYFYLVRTFKEVPLITDASIDDTQNYALAKAPEREILDTIESDLETAKLYAVKDYGRTDYNKGRITLDAVNAILADVYLWDASSFNSTTQTTQADQKYTKCVDACDAVMSDHNLKLVSGNFVLSKVFFLGNSSESIFEIPQFNDQSPANRPIYNLYGSAAIREGDLIFPVSLAYNEETSTVGTYSPFDYKISSTVIESEHDIRAKDSYNLELSGGGVFTIFKYLGLRTVGTTGKSSYTYRTDSPDWIFYRLSDVILMKAEALVQLGGTANDKSAIDLVNKTYLRSNPTADSLKIDNYPNKSDLAELVLRERHRELLFEGKRWFDLVRYARREGNTSTLNKFVNHKASSSSSGASLGAPVMDAMYMPIAQSELEANKNLIQNEFYKLNDTSSSR